MKTLTKEDMIDDATRLGVELEVVQAVALVESNGGGFDPEGFPKTLFEAHIFSRLTGGRFNKTHPNLSTPKWDRTTYGRSWRDEKARLAKAIALDREAALMSASWGLFQIMGMNHVACGFKTVQQFVTAMCRDENSQLEAFTAFIMSNRLDGHLRNRNWAEFARRYNGPSYAANKYDIKMKNAYEKFKAENKPK